MEKILLVEDEYRLSQYIQSELSQNGYHCDIAYDGEIAGKLLTNQNFDLVLLDINIPKKNGLQICKELRQTQPKMPILMITALGDIDTKLEAYDLGVDDYLIKPIHPRELLAKVKIFLKRRSNDYLPAVLKLGDVTIDIDQKKVLRNDMEIELSPKEFDIIHYLAKANKRIISKSELADRVWTDNYIVSTNTIEVYISFLRNKLDQGFDKKLILTKHGFGYYLNPEVCGSR